MNERERERERERKRVLRKTKVGISLHDVLWGFLFQEMFLKQLNQPYICISLVTGQGQRN